MLPFINHINELGNQKIPSFMAQINDRNSITTTTSKLKKEESGHFKWITRPRTA